jgi:hypothetical protein
VLNYACLYIKEASALGAHKFLNVNDGRAMKLARNSLDFMLSTISADNVDWFGQVSVNTTV